jgi:pimeloyl-ACP methyl ester carboxylesterase
MALAVVLASWIKRWVMIEILDRELRSARHLVVAFTGIAHKLGGIPFEFHKSIGAIRCAPLFVRDLKCQWYQYDEAAIIAVTERIEQARRSTGAERLVCLGNSMGGFGALLFGSMLNADAILAFCPQTTIDPAVTSALGDDRWRAYQDKIVSYPRGDLAKEIPARGRVIVCYGRDDKLDAAHVERVRPSWKPREVIVDDAHHDAAAALKARGQLLPLIRESIELD